MNKRFTPNPKSAILIEDEAMNILKNKIAIITQSKPRWLQQGL